MIIAPFVPRLSISGFRWPWEAVLPCLLLTLALVLVVGATGCNRSSRVVGEQDGYTPENVAEQLLAEQAAAEAASEE